MADGLRLLSNPVDPEANDDNDDDCHQGHPQRAENSAGLTF
ncbi:Uncharacterised protein [Mycobacteroides abscessus]|nr:Uncharacterised protein [Mycobacteroides abscessus]SLC72191.1 Uncharacterised protein [Mycobacteroides abscessus subsp. massiliense]